MASSAAEAADIFSHCCLVIRRGPSWRRSGDNWKIQCSGPFLEVLGLATAITLNPSSTMCRLLELGDSHGQVQDLWRMTSGGRHMVEIALIATVNDTFKSSVRRRVRLVSFVWPKPPAKFDFESRLHSFDELSDCVSAQWRWRCWQTEEGHIWLVYTKQQLLLWIKKGRDH